MRYINFNGSFLAEDAPVVRATSRGLRYGDGFFETMRMVHGEIKLEALHIERISKSARVLKINLPQQMEASDLMRHVRATVEKNHMDNAARIRLMIFRGEGGLSEVDAPANFIIETSALEAAKLSLNEKGLHIGIYKDGVKACDQLSNVKSNNFLPHVMAALYAKDHEFDECLVLNSFERICDSTIANLFWIKNEVIYTPPLTEGCVAGVMRRHLLQSLPAAGFAVIEKAASIDVVMNADEVFLTNAVRGIRWVNSIDQKTFSNSLTRSIFSSTFFAD